MRSICLNFILIFILIFSADVSAKKKGSGAYIEVKSPRVHNFAIRVLNDGKKYVAVKNSYLPVKFDVLLKARCGNRYHQDSAYFSVAGTSTNIPVNKKNKTFSKNFRKYSFSVPYADPKYSIPPVKACNTALTQAALSKGKTKSALLQSGWSKNIYETYFYRGTFKLTCKENRKGLFDEPKYYSASANLGVAYECLKSASANKPKPKSHPKPKRAKTPFKVSKATLAVDKPSYHGKCPVNLKFTATFTSTKKGKAKYRILGSGGSLSPVKTVTFKKAGKVQIPFVIKKGKSQKSSAITGMNITTSKKKSTLNNLTSQPSNVFAGWYQIQMLSPNKMKSNKQTFKVFCQDHPKRYKKISG